MLNTEDTLVRAKSVRFGQLTEVEMRKAARDNEVVRKALAMRKDLPGDLYWILSMDEDLRVVQAIAGNEATPKSVVDSLAQQLEIIARKHANESTGTLDPTFKARLLLANRQDLSPYATEKLLTDPRTEARKTLAENYFTSEGTLYKLLADRKSEVSQAALNALILKENSEFALK